MFSAIWGLKVSYSWEQRTESMGLSIVYMVKLGQRLCDIYLKLVQFCCYRIFKKTNKL